MLLILHRTSDTCSDGTVGVEADGACCELRCGTCGGDDCSSNAEMAGMSDSRCCTSLIYDLDDYCADTRKAPCILGEFSYPRRTSILVLWWMDVLWAGPGEHDDSVSMQYHTAALRYPDHEGSTMLTRPPTHRDYFMKLHVDDLWISSNSGLRAFSRTAPFMASVSMCANGVQASHPNMYMGTDLS